MWRFANKYLCFPALIVGIISANGAANNPRLLGSWPGYQRDDILDLVVSGNYAFAASGQTGLQVFDISTREKPRLVGQCSLGGYALALTLSGNYAYVADGAN